MSPAADFWSRRKAAVLAEAEAERAATEAVAYEAELKAIEEKSDEEILAELKLPDPETLAEGDDFSGFLAKAVPERIRRRALRKLWLSNPTLANLDGLIEYGEDYTDGATVVEGLQTAYQVGKGMLKHVAEMAKQENGAEAGDAPDGDDAFEASPPEAPGAIEPIEIQETELEATGGGERSSQEAEEAEETRPLRRMRFSFETRSTPAGAALER